MRAALSGYRERAANEAMGEAPGADARLYVQELRLTNFRNYERAAASLDERPVVLVGDNGAGKTNLLEAVSLLGAGQGLRGRPYDELARKDSAGGWAVAATVMSLEGVVEIGTGFGLAGPSEGSGRSVRALLPTMCSSSGWSRRWMGCLPVQPRSAAASSTD
jgi:RecF/RecN/SMC N terminal domain